MNELLWPFLGSEALAAEAIPERAMRSLYEAVYPGVYIPSGIELTASQRAQAAWLWSRRRAVVVGQSAAALHGTRWVDPLQPAELAHDNRHSPPMLTVHTDTLLGDEVMKVNGIAVTTPARTAFDTGRRTTSRLQAVQRLDALTHVTDVKINEVAIVMAQHSGVRGLTRLRRILPLVDGGAESPQETRTRLVGPQHWTDRAQRDRDIDRYTALLDLGWTIVRATSDLLRYRQGTFIARVVAAMSAAG
ncbi:MAG: hypothetical protein JO106_13880 [Mycobacterium sp.]|nr:hypothetical protein [Mycobacterium sp.]